MAKSTQKKYAGFVSIVETIASELYSKKQWEDVTADESNHGLNMEHLSMLEEVYSTAYTRNPDVFNGIQWINSDYGMPAWVRPGVEWEPQEA